MTLIFIILMMVVFGKLIILAMKAAWGITKVLVTIIFFPLVLIGMVFAGAIYLAIGLLIVCGIGVFAVSALS